MTESRIDDAERTARLMRLLGDPTRIRILSLVARQARTVSGLCEAIGLAQPTISHHLGLLRQAGLLSAQREGKHMRYTVNPDHLVSDPDRGTMRLAWDAIEVRLGGRRGRSRPLTASGADRP